MVERNQSGAGVYIVGGEYTVEKHGVEKNIRCTKYGFVVKKTAYCNGHEPLEAPL